jgi:hypothetical protein
MLEIHRRYRAENRELYAAAAKIHHQTPKGRAALMLNNNKRRAAKLQALPAWADQKAIAKIYRKAAMLRSHGEDVHVDHTIPLQRMYGNIVVELNSHNHYQLSLAVPVPEGHSEITP